MSYLNISEAAWSLVLSKDPRIKPPVRSPGYIGATDSSCNQTDRAVTTAAQFNVAGQCQAITSQPVQGQLAAHGRDLHQQQSQSTTGTVDGAFRRKTGDLPIDLLFRQKSTETGDTPAAWLISSHGQAWQAASAAAAREAIAAHKQILGQLEQRRAALLKDIGQARELDLKVLLQMVATYTDDIMALLSASQAAALKVQQSYTAQLTATTAAALGGSIEAALDAAHKKHQEQLSHLQHQHTTQLESARLSAKQQLTAAVQLQQQQADEQLHRQLKQLDEGWSSRCRVAEAAAATQEALKGHAETECNKLRAELAAAKREAANWRCRWEKDPHPRGSNTGGWGDSATVTSSGALSKAASGVPTAFEVGCISTAGSRVTVTSRPPSRLS